MVGVARYVPLIFRPGGPSAIPPRRAFAGSSGSREGDGGISHPQRGRSEEEDEEVRCGTARVPFVFSLSRLVVRLRVRDRTAVHIARTLGRKEKC